MEAIAKHDFSATADDELSFRKTQILKVSHKGIPYIVQTYLNIVELDFSYAHTFIALINLHLYAKQRQTLQLTPRRVESFSHFPFACIICKLQRGRCPSSSSSPTYLWPGRRRSRY